MSSSQKTKNKGTQTNNEEKVAEYLKKHPDFFDRHPDVLAELDLSHQCGSAVSLIERQVSALRQQYQSSKQQLESLVQIARDNDKLSERMHKLTLALMDANTLNEIYVAVDDILRGDFKVDAVNIKLFIDPDEAAIEPDNELMQTIFVPINDPKLDEYRNIISHEKPTCGLLKPEQLSYMFGDNATDIKSTAVIPLGGDNCTSIECAFLGLLTIGSRDPNRFHAKIGTLFLSNLGDIVSRAIRPYIAQK